MVLPYLEDYVTSLSLGYMPNKAKNWTGLDLETLTQKHSNRVRKSFYLQMMSQPVPTPPRPQIFPRLLVMFSTNLHSHHTPQHPMSHPHAFLASAFPPICHCMHLCTFTLVHVHHAHTPPAPLHITHPLHPDIMDNG